MSRVSVIVRLCASASAALLCGACVCSRDRAADSGYNPTAVVQSFKLDIAKAQADMAELTKAPHPFGSTRQSEVLDWIERRIKESGVLPARQVLTAAVPNAKYSGTGPEALTLERSGANIYAAGTVREDAPCVVALGTHVDTKELSFTSYLGANDSGSSTVALLQMLAFLKSKRGQPETACDIVGIFFDGEEAVLSNWNDGLQVHPAQIQDNTYGSRHAAAQLTNCMYEGHQAKCLPKALGGTLASRPVVALILMDMIGSPGLTITRDTLSSPALQDLAAHAAKALGSPQAYDGGVPKAIEDDHIPFRNIGVPALDLIDFNHLDTWHTLGDDPGTISYESVDLAAKIALWVSLSVASQPKVFLSPAE